MDQQLHAGFFCFVFLQFVYLVSRLLMTLFYFQTRVSLSQFVHVTVTRADKASPLLPLTDSHTQQVKTETNRAEQWRSFHLHRKKEKKRESSSFVLLPATGPQRYSWAGRGSPEGEKKNLCFCSTEVKVDSRFSFCRFWNDVAVISPVDEPDVHEDIRGFSYSWLHFSHPTQLIHTKQSTVSCSSLHFTTNQTCFVF